MKAPAQLKDLVGGRRVEVAGGLVVPGRPGSRVGGVLDWQSSGQVSRPTRLPELAVEQPCPDGRHGGALVAGRLTTDEEPPPLPDVAGVELACLRQDGPELGGIRLGPPGVVRHPVGGGRPRYL